MSLDKQHTTLPSAAAAAASAPRSTGRSHSQRLYQGSTAPHHHINTILPPEIGSFGPLPDNVFRQGSLQDEIDVGLAISKASPSASASAAIESPRRPRTFAEATMASGPLLDADQADEPSRTKITFKKKKKKLPKWQPLDLSEANASAEAEAGVGVGIGVGVGVGIGVRVGVEVGVEADAEAEVEAEVEDEAEVEEADVEVEVEAEGGDDARSAAASSALPTRAITPILMVCPVSHPPSPSTIISSSFTTAKTSIPRSIDDDDDDDDDDADVEDCAEETGGVNIYGTPIKGTPVKGTHVKHASIVSAASTSLDTASASPDGDDEVGIDGDDDSLWDPFNHSTPTQAYFPAVSLGGDDIGGDDGSINDGSINDGGINDTGINDGPTPPVSQTQFPVPFNHIRLSLLDQGTFGGDDNEDLDRSDTQSTKQRTAAALACLNATGTPTATAMAPREPPVTAGEDLFDSVEWDPELPKAPSPRESPEPIVLKPQPVAYTTVGSLVDPKAVPQFSAPNRIQREGAHRRPLPLSMMQSKHLVETGFLHARGPAPALSMAHNMQYAQQIGRKPADVGPSSSSSLSSALSARLTDPEMEAIEEELAGDGGGPHATTYLYENGTNVRGDENRKLYAPRDVPDGGVRGRSNSVQGSLQGMEKMQTLQRLSRFENPMREMARNRLAELSLKSQMVGKTVGNPHGLTPYELSLQHLQPAMLPAAAEPSRSADDLNPDYQFPPPGLAAPQVNPLRAALHASQTNPPPPRAGMPQPLTAGPPGQRHFLSASGPFGGSAAPNAQQQQSQGGTQWQAAGDWDYSQGAGPAASASPFPPGAAQHQGYPSTPVYDTMARDQAAKYYPHGFPEGLNAYRDPWHPVAEADRKAMDRSSCTPEEDAALRKKDGEDTHYQGQRRYVTMDMDDHLEEHERAQERQAYLGTNTWGTIAPPKRILHPVIPAKISTEEAIHTPVAHTVVPLLAGAYGTLLAYQETGPGSRSRMSGFVTPAAHLIDASASGNDTMFGEDWGNPNFPHQETKPASTRSTHAPSARGTTPLDALREIGNTRRAARPADGTGKW